MAWRDATAIVGILAGAGLGTVMAARSGAWVSAVFAASLPLAALLEWWTIKREGTAMPPERMLVWILALVLALVALASDMASPK